MFFKHFLNGFQRIWFQNKPPVVVTNAAGSSGANDMPSHGFCCAVERCAKHQLPWKIASEGIVSTELVLGGEEEFTENT
jgi:hypothetical protein